MNERIAISVNNVSKNFKLPHQKASSIKDIFIRPLQVFRKHKTVEAQHALRNISFDVREGEFFGIVGRNGSGKSTLLKILAEIYQPTSGEVSVRGRLVPFIELGVGFNPELTGRENVYLNGALLGFSEEEVEAMYDDIVSFAELEEFMDQRLKNYSSGMQVRLAFSVATRANADVLILDEVLAVGDESFQRKCFEYFATLKRDKKTVILVTHDMEMVTRFCTRAALVDKEHKLEIGNPLKIAQVYRQLNDKNEVTVNTKNYDLESSTKYVAVSLKYTQLDNKHVFDIQLKQKVKLEDPIVAMGIYQETGEQIYRWTSDEKIGSTFNMEAKSRIKIELEDILPVGEFTVNLYIKKKDRSIDYAIFNEIVKFEVKNLTSRKHATFWRIPEKTFVNGEEMKNVY
jgi:ABC-2 type transport system ATP-binding protein